MAIKTNHIDAHADTWHQAGWIVVDSQTIIPNGKIHVSKGRITALETGKPSGPDPIIDHGRGALMPALINAHTHLELSALKGKLPLNYGFDAWVRHLIRVRNQLGEEALQEGIRNGIEELLATGCGAIGEIATLGLSDGPFFSSPLGGIWFKEYLGVKPDDFPIIANNPSDRTSMAGHAPHTTSPDLLANLKNITRRHLRPFSIHLSESIEEVTFIRSGKGPWADLLRERQIDFSSWPLPARSPVDYLDRLDILDEKTLAVHLLQADTQDIEILAGRGVTTVICPRSNQNLHHRLPDLACMRGAGLKICLGTDSLASCESLSMFDEMEYTAKRFESFSPETIFAMATSHGAEALGLESDYGRLVPGYLFSAVYVPLMAARPETVLEKIVTAQFSRKIESVQ